ncbi:putative SOS response-associated peptidase YedK [Limimaricola soesokkakensis]|uniref:Abasic site processing protein n=1 Tax=Limimaricola soesokkakensis TaxID=1343159 RepID=A0A1X6YWX8_9RHOB|nr:SOS response-associated peptidase [Limimaricola soesokkakensis]PSK87696.1 putative SOS response-associated peptidase YedK [Limimaricola soesokkakensis]SLN33197.1 Putative SOS response-associated peptidase YedK [Limimaricola soesokkakensis]
MCGRMAITLPHDAMAQIFGATPANDLPDVPNYNVCPTVQVHSVTSDGDSRRLRPMRWGFIPHWYKTLTDGPLLINARAETVAEKPAFRAAVRERRCLIPASGFYEWTVDEDGNKLPWFIHREDGDPLAFAGLWQGWEREGESFVTCAVVTTGATGRMRNIHSRMPVVLEPGDWPLWLGEAGHGAAVLMKPNPEVLAFHRVDPKVNSNRASGPELIEPIDV